MMSNEKYHIPVLLEECIEGLAINKAGTYVDGTMGGGGHFQELVKKLDRNGVAVGIDRDLDAINRNKNIFKNQVTPKIIIEHNRFSEFDVVLRMHGIKSINGLILDLGVSSWQIDDVSRGFSYKQNAKLDMRMNSNDTQTAAQLLVECDEVELLHILKDFGDVRNPGRMAGTIKKYLKNKSIETSNDLKECLEQEYGKHLKYKVLSKVFQALRIAVNTELTELRECLKKSIIYLQSGGRLVILAYHSLEDRIVKNFLREGELSCICPPRELVCRCSKKQTLRRVNRKAIHASAEEIERNPRARSAVLRIAEKIESSDIHGGSYEK